MTIKRFEFNMFPVNCYVLWDETKEAVILDAGCFYPEEQQKLKEFIHESGLTLKHVLNTHLHLDHIFGNAFVAREFGIRPQAHQADEFLIQKLDEYCSHFGFHANEEAPALSGYIQDADEITFGNTTLKAIHVPGHSPGGIAYYNEEDECVFSGDVLFRCSVGRSDFEGGSARQLTDSILNKLFSLPDATIVYPGHGEATQIGYEKKNNPYFSLRNL